MSRPDKRQHARNSISLTGILRAGNAPGAPAVGCEIQDLSVGGVRIALAAPMDVPVAVAVVIEIGQFGSYVAEVAWADYPVFGLRFKESPETMVEMITAVALYA